MAVKTGIGDKEDRRSEEIIDTAERSMKGSKGKKKGRRNGKKGPGYTRNFGKPHNDSGKGSNPVGTYVSDEDLKRAAGQLSFSNIVGVPFNISRGLGLVDSDKLSIPGICVINFNPTLPPTATTADPVNVAAEKLWTWTIKNTGRNPDYDAADQMMVLIAASNLFMFHEHLKRIYRAINSFTPVNRYFNKTILKAMGVDPDDVIRNQYSLFTLIQILTEKCSALAIPKTLEYTERCKWLTSEVYTDSRGKYGQLYIFVPEYFWTFRNTAETGTQLYQTQFWQEAGTTVSTSLTVKQLWDLSETLLSQIWMDSDAATICADFINAFGSMNCYHLESLSSTDVLEPKYNPEVLSQIENSTCVGVLQRDLVISQNPDVNNGTIQFAPVYRGTSDLTSGSTCVYSMLDKIINLHDIEVPSPEDVIVATRLMTTCKSMTSVITTKDYVSVTLDKSGTEVVSRYTVFTGLYGTDADPLQMGLTNGYIVGENAPDNDYNLWIASYMAQFDWGPMVIPFQYTVPSSGAPKFSNLRMIGLDRKSVV